MKNIKFIYLNGQALVHSEQQGKDYLVEGQFYCEVENENIIIKDFHPNNTPEDIMCNEDKAY